ncbi:histidine kinase/DNA gyrase B/HSP90-like ATPase [Kribbella sp. VKM Ac-2571]|uniref:sensor histidine kinase n=1 Tax=Kribbella sp. VKM Ac-2571 TaxID=2512222 RepID=UPI00105ED202|nr:HAMP domain-containing sensor histidine kinase [Kribbella sp. VKM Ac-2571]TDO48910.1 histidine kinase/DNA gyrase B/HSP90-like ATPase [Kribbella sp. VKM Ac-2571]
MSSGDASPARGGFADDPEHLLRLCHDLRQYVAAGLCLSEPTADPGAEPARLALIRQQFDAIAELLDVEQAPTRRIGGVNLTQLAGECADVVRLTYRAPVIFERVARVVVAGDQALLRRAIGNLLDNACRAAGGTGHVQVSVGTADDEAYVEVSDDGPGFGDVAAGTGHGLQVVAAAARTYDGRLEISSVPGSGTTVRLCLSGGHRAVRPV